MDLFGNNDLSTAGRLFLESAKELKKWNPEQFRALFLMEERSIISRPISGKFGWWVLPNETNEFNILKLKLFQILLFNYEYTLLRSYEEFEIHHIGEEVPKEKIPWCGEIQVLPLLFYKLQQKQIISIPQSAFYNLLIEHFQILDKKTNSLKELGYGSLKTSLSAARKNPFIERQVDNLIALLIS